VSAIQQIPMFVVNPQIDIALPIGEGGQPDAPTCPSCRLRPVRWNHRRQEHYRFCGASNCSNHEAKCSWCGTVYQRGSAGSGTKYCSPDCKAAGYGTNFTPTYRPTTATPCAICGQVLTGRKISAEVCFGCRHRYSGQIKKHHLTTEWAVRLITATNCDVCGERLPTKDSKNQAVVDHDHACCPKQESCGRCVRGILCNRCNMVAGAVEKDAARHEAVMAYLAASATRISAADATIDPWREHGTGGPGPG
jgi:hypothetical protein